MLTVSFIRHGESFDNLTSVWAGQRDAELSELGERQAKALGDSYANTQLDAIITSDLKRARATAEALLNNQPDPKPSFKADRDLREISFGDAEGKTWMHPIPGKSLEDHLRDGQYPIFFGRDDKFPNAESLNDLAVRAERAIDNLVLKPYLSSAISSGAEDVHVAVVSHGLCISELIAALLKRNGGGAPTKDYKGLLNTAWSRVTVQAKPGTEIPRISSELESPLIVTVTDVNRHEHATNVKYQKGTAQPEPNHRSVREFFAGGGTKADEAGIQKRN